MDVVDGSGDPPVGVRGSRWPRAGDEARKRGGRRAQHLRLFKRGGWVRQGGMQTSQAASQPLVTEHHRRIPDTSRWRLGHIRLVPVPRWVKVEDSVTVAVWGSGFSGVHRPGRDEKDGSGRRHVTASFKLEGRRTLVDGRDRPGFMQMGGVAMGNEAGVERLSARKTRGSEVANPIARYGPRRWWDRNSVQYFMEPFSHDHIMPLPLKVVATTEPDDVRTFPFGYFELFSIGGQQFGRAVYAPGWRWSEHVAPLAGTATCQVEHVGLVTAGQAAVRMDDGTEVTIATGDFFSIPAGHDSWVLGDDDYISLHFLGAQQYAARGSDRPSPRSSDSPIAPVGLHNAERFAWGDGCEGWTLLADPQLHVVRERMPPGAAEQRHHHEQTVQLYVILDGTATVEIAGHDRFVTAGESIELPPGASHQIRNDTTEPLEFLVASSQPPRDDRSDLP